MKAIVYTKYGSPNVLQFKEVAMPVPKDNEVLIKVHAASINSWDWDMIRGEPFIVRLWGLFGPRYTIPGADVAGYVEAVGKNVKKFREGDEVFGDLCECGWGSYAEYVCANENALTIKPPSVTFEQAAAIPQAGALALQSVLDKGHIKPGQKVLINGAGGGVGTFVIQLAKMLGADVTGVDRAEKLDLLLSIGADHVIDYRKENFTGNGKRYDLIIDVISNRSIYDYRQSLTPEGKFVMIGGSMKAIIQAMLFSRWVSSTEKKPMGMLAYKPNKDMDYLAKFCGERKVIPIIDRCYPLQDTPDAFWHFSTGLAYGKVIITMK